MGIEAAIEQMKFEAREEGYRLGHEQGFEHGTEHLNERVEGAAIAAYKNGYNDGKAKAKQEFISKYDTAALIAAAKGMGLHLIDGDQRAVYNNMLGFVGETTNRLGL